MLSGILAIIYIYPLAALGFPAINPPLAYRFKGASYTFDSNSLCDHQRQTSECASKMTDRSRLVVLVHLTPLIPWVPIVCFLTNSATKPKKIRKSRIIRNCGMPNHRELNFSGAQGVFSSKACLLNKPGRIDAKR